jgi:hypothetical protein
MSTTHSDPIEWGCRLESVYEWLFGGLERTQADIGVLENGDPGGNHENELPY